VELKYYKYDDEFGPTGGITFIEAMDGWAIRALNVSGDQRLASNMRHPRWGIFLPEGQVDYDQIAQVTAIDQEEFDRAWGEHLHARLDLWEAAKVALTLGASVRGRSNIHVPQGILIDVGSPVLGIAEFNQYLASLPPGVGFR
jgi:hypothetical protein